MKRFVVLVLGSVAVFLVGAMIQEWDVFAQPWFGGAASSATVPDKDLETGARTVREYLTLSSHLYGTGGDRRFAERIPAAENIVDEILHEIEYLKMHGIIEEPSLQRVEPLDFVPHGPGGLEIHTKEYWIVRRHAVGHKDLLDNRSYVVFNVYRLSRSGPDAWRIVGWEPEVPASPVKESAR